MSQFRVPVLENFSWQQPVISMSLSTPPVSPTKGDRYVVASSPSGAWTGHTNHIAWYDGAAWLFDIPNQGWTLINLLDNTSYEFNGSSWSAGASISGKADKVSGAVNGDLAALDGTGNLTDSGVSTSSVNTAISNAQTAFDSRAIYDTELGVIKFNL